MSPLPRMLSHRMNLVANLISEANRIRGSFRTYVSRILCDCILFEIIRSFKQNHYYYENNNCRVKIKELQ